MKSLLISLLTFCFSVPTFSAVVEKASIDRTGKFLLVDISFSGGCGRHRFRLTVNEACKESQPVQCSATLTHASNDRCEAHIERTLRFPLARLNMNDPYYDQAYLTIHGDGDSEATVQLP